MQTLLPISMNAQARRPKPVFNFRLDNSTRKELESLAASSTNASGNRMNISEYMRALIDDAREKGTVIEQEYSTRLVERRVSRKPLRPPKIEGSQ